MWVFPINLGMFLHTNLAATTKVMLCVLCFAYHLGHVVKHKGVWELGVWNGRWWLCHKSTVGKLTVFVFEIDTYHSKYKHRL